MAGLLGRPPVHPLALDGDGGDGEGPQGAFPSRVEEVVGAGSDERAVAEPRREDRQHERQVDVAGVVGGEDGGTVEVLDAVEAVDAG